MEDAALDAEPLRQGRRYAYTGRVGSITVSPGRLAAPVFDEPDGPYRTTILLEPLTGAEWERLLDAVAARAGHIAALLDKDMPPSLVDSAADAGVRLLPGVGELQPECTCPDWEFPCRHAAALCYQAAWLLDRDPFVLLLLRGSGQRELLDELARRTAPSPEASGVAVPRTGTPAHEAFAVPVPPLPASPGEPGAETALIVPPGPGVDPRALRLLAANAAARARALLTDAALPSTPWHDAARIASEHPDLVTAPPPDLTRAAAAWRYGGPDALETLESTWDPPADVVARATQSLAEALDDPPDVTRNRWTVGAAGQVRYSRGGRWYPFRDVDGQWSPAGPPSTDPVTALADLLVH
jgi:hypothetical protein